MPNSYYDAWTERMARRQFLRWGGALGAAAAIAPGQLPRLAVAAGAPGSLSAKLATGTRPFPGRPAGVPQPDLAPELANIEHIVLVMNENHSFDAYMGMLGWRVPSKAGKVDGFATLGADGMPNVTQADDKGNIYRAFPALDQCGVSGYARPQGPGNNNGWDGSHRIFNGGRMDGFVREGGEAAMQYWDDQHLLGFLYSLASYFPVGDRYFSSTLAPTYPNRVFALTGSAGGITSTDTPPPDVIPPNGRIFDVLETYGVSWGDYFTDLPSAGLLGKQWAAQRVGTHFFQGGDPTNIETELALVEARMIAESNGAGPGLESVVLLEQVFTQGDEEPPQSMLTGQYFLYKVISLFLKYPKVWAKTLICFNYDEAGGFYDHVAPPLAPAPGDGTKPNLPQAQWFGDNYNRLGFRVPNCFISPWSRPGHVSHVTYDHTSILRTIQRKWNLPGLTARDTNANDLRDMLVPNYVGGKLLSIDQAPFGDPSKVVLVPATPPTPTGNPVVDSNICANNQAATVAKFPPAVSGPASGHGPGGPSSGGGGGPAGGNGGSGGVPNTGTGIPPTIVISSAVAAAVTVGAGALAAGRLGARGRVGSDPSEPGEGEG
ncbi:MAG: alkaline phosphatase family protein [Candidatus Dormibacteria bacterium]